jgi:hypothetical protein
MLPFNEIRMEDEGSTNPLAVTEVVNHLFKLLVSRILLSDTPCNKTLQLKKQERIQLREEFANIHEIENIFLA